MAARPNRRIGAIAYWTIAVFLTAFGFIDLIAIGGPFFAVGLAMLVFGRWRHDRHVFLPGFVAMLAFFVGFALVVPWVCVTELDGVTTCRHVFGIVHEGPESLRPALIAGLIVAGAVWLAVRRLTKGRAPRDTAPV